MGNLYRCFLLLLCLFFVLPVLACSKSDKLVFSPDSLPEAKVDQPYSVTITLSNQRTPAFSMSAAEGDLPPGLTGVFDQEQQSYTISGTPSQAGTYKIGISVLCYGTQVSGQTGAKTYELVVK
jgi:hypothetical protein